MGSCENKLQTDFDWKFIGIGGGSFYQAGKKWTRPRYYIRSACNWNTQIIFVIPVIIVPYRIQKKPCIQNTQILFDPLRLFFTKNAFRFLKKWIRQVILYNNNLHKKGRIAKKMFRHDILQKKREKWKIKRCRPGTYSCICSLILSITMPLLWNTSLLILVMTKMIMMMKKMIMTMTMPGDNKVLRAWGVRRQMMESVTGRWAAPLWAICNMQSAVCIDIAILQYCTRQCAIYAFFNMQYAAPIDIVLDLYGVTLYCAL